MIRINDDTNSKIALFGNGSIKITSAYIDGKGMLGLNEHDPHIIGSSIEITKESSERIDDLLKSEILFEFTDIKSVEVVILQLQEVRAMMLGLDLDKIDEWKKINNITTIYQPNDMIDGGLI